MAETIAASRLSSNAISNARRMRRRRYRRRRIASSNSRDGILGRDFLVAELPSRGHDLGHPLGGLVTLSRAGWHGGDEQRNHSGKKKKKKKNELAKLKWVDLSDGYARREQGTEDAALVATTRLNANGRAPVGR